MSKRKPGDPLSGAEPVYHSYCWPCRTWMSCEHSRSARHRSSISRNKVGTRNDTIAQLMVNRVRVTGVRWDGDLDSILIPYNAYMQLLSSVTWVEFVQLDPEYVVWMAKWAYAVSAAEQVFDLFQCYKAIPRHTLSEYRTLTRGPTTGMFKVRKTKSTRPCFCWHPQCPERSLRVPWYQRTYEGPDDPQADLLLRSEHGVSSLRLKEIMHGCVPVYTSDAGVGGVDGIEAHRAGARETG